MGSILRRKRKDGSIGYTALLRFRRDGKIAHTESQTFDDEADANKWIKRREAQLARPGALEAAIAPAKAATVGEIIDRYTKESRRAIGKTKAQVLKTAKTFDIAEKRADKLTSADIVAFARDLGAGGRQPQTVTSHLSHLGAVLLIARSAWGVPLDRSVMQDARDACRALAGR